ncbi:MAG: hypothetical protein JXR90_13875, partial [Spirochaetes bacterium]|nr:hypothetical protein [Spirochaetota bacterium]
FQKVIQRWFADYDQFKHIYEMYFQTIYTKQTLAFNFLSLAQALDSYTWIHIENKANYSKQMKKLLPSKEFTRRKNLILKNIPDNESEVREWIIEQLDNALGFKDRLLTLFEDYKSVFISINNKENFARSIVETRNAISHGYSEEQYKKKKFCYMNNDLNTLFFGTKMILSAVFLRKIGFDDEKISECLKRETKYKYILEGKYKFEEKKIEKVKK